MSGIMKLFGRRPSGLAPLALERGQLLTLEDLLSATPRHQMEAAFRARCHAVSLDPHTVLCRVLGRYKLLVDSRDLGLAPHLMMDGYWEFWCTDFMLRRIRPGQVAWDIGANLGYYSVLMSDLVGEKGRVLALEPNPRLAQLTERTLLLNGFRDRAEVRRLAAADRGGGVMRFHATLADPMNGRLLPEGEGDDEGAEAPGIAVRTTRLDDLGGGKVDFIKIDVEGAEEQVWAGMQGVLDRSPDITVLMEFNALRCKAAEATLAAIAARFPLRELRLDAHVVPVAISEILTRQEDTLLVLTRG